MSFDITKLQEAQAKLSSAEKIEDVKEAVASVLDIANAIAQESERLVAERAADQAKASEIQKAKDEAVAAAEQLKSEMEAVKAQLVEMQNAQAALAAEIKFNERMAALDETFDLADAERALLIDDVKSLDDEAFAKWMDKNTILMKEKTKAFKAEAKKKEDEMKKESEEKAKCKASEDNDEDDKGGDSDKDEDDKDKEAKASIEGALKTAVASVGDSALSQATVESGVDLRTKMKEAFANGISIGGVKLKDIKAKTK